MWKENWDETRQRFIDWWKHDGLLVGSWPSPVWGEPHEVVPEPKSPPSMEAYYCDVCQRALRNHYDLSRTAFPMDVLPLCETDLGPGSLALFIGSEPDFAHDTVWYKATLVDIEDPEELPSFKFDPANKWWRLTEDTLKACADLGRGKYLVGCPDLIENVDILSALRDPQTFMIDMIESPEWVEEKIREINQVWFEAYQRIHDIIKDEEGGSAFGAFRLYGPGKTAKVQCDASAMFSPEMFRRFVVPSLNEQCAWLDNAMYHLDGTQAVCHLDALLEIDSLDAIEWTPQAGIETGGNPRWFDMYRKILESGKSLQIVGVERQEIGPLLDAVGTRGVYILTEFSKPEDVTEIENTIARYTRAG